MRFEYSASEDIPKLAWGLSFRKGDNNIQVVHGEWVETRENFFVEGTWDGDFEEGEIEKVESLMGSGGVIRDNKLVICPPSHTTESLYSVIKDDCLWVSNSLTFALNLSSTSLDFNFLNYEDAFLSASDGLSRYQKTIPLENENKLNIHFHNNLQVNSNLDIIEIPKPLPPKFSSFKDYKTYLDKVLINISNNSSDSKRIKQYNPIVFCSNGYDSVACAALGKNIGCSEAVVFESKRASRSDSGRPIVEQLGYEIIHEKHELEYKNIDLAHEFVASGELGTSIYFSASERELESKMLLSGVHGDKMWDMDTTPDNDLKRSFYPDLAKKEFRLRVGFLNVVIPFIGAKRQPEVLKISNSKEMKLWSVGNDYDRPIARRIAEEMGVTRESFGIHKSGGTASSLRFLNIKYLEKIMPKGSFEDFEQFYKIVKSKRRKSLEWFYRSILYLIYCGSIFLEQKKFSLPYKILRIEKWKRKNKCSPWAPSFLIYWGVNVLSDKYKKGVDLMNYIYSDYEEYEISEREAIFK